MSYTTEHRRLKPVLDRAARLDIAFNSAAEALFEPGNGGFQVWCTPQDHPVGWEDVQMIAGDFSKPCEYVGSVCWHWTGEKIDGIEISTDAYALHEKGIRDYHNRPADIEWIKAKVTWLFEQAEVPLMPFFVSGK